MKTMSEEFGELREAVVGLGWAVAEALKLEETVAALARLIDGAGEGAGEMHPARKHDLRMKRLLRLRPRWFCSFRHRMGPWTDWEKDDRYNPNRLTAVRWCGSCQAYEVKTEHGKIIKGSEAKRLAEEKALD